MKRVCITGGGGFIGSNLADRLVRMGVEVVVLDNFRTGRKAFIHEALDNPLFTLVEGDVLDSNILSCALAGCDWVFHLQGNADVRHGLEHPTVDLEQNTIATSRVLEAMRLNGVSRVLFSSTGSVYGEPSLFPTPEDAPFPEQTSLYGASKLAAEGLIAAYCAGFSFTSIICRFVSILGERYTHGHVFDFCKALQEDPDHLAVLGDGKQEKSYLYVQDCIDAMLTATEYHRDDIGFFTYNLGTDETVTVDESISIITAQLGLGPAITHTGGLRGWVGDSPLILLDTSKIRSLGWAPKLTITESISRTVDWLRQNEYALSVIHPAPDHGQRPRR